jgi:putative ABC transport system permease protein
MIFRYALNLLGLAGKQLIRHRMRTLLTLAGVVTGMFLFATVETLQSSLRRATETSATDTTLVVYRENRFCPATSRLPEHYIESIRQIDGVAQVIPLQIVVNNCGASLDIVAFRGVPANDLLRFAPEVKISAGSVDQWQERSDAALIGRHLAQRRGLQVGDSFDAAGVRVYVAGIIQSGGLQDENVAYVHLPFLQQSSRVGLGVVTQFNVKVDSAEKLGAVADAIDRRFATDSYPTNTRPEKAFFAQTASDLVELIGFTRWLGLAAVVAVVGLVANTILLTVRARISDLAVMMTLGYPDAAIGWLVLAEGLLIGLVGGAVGVGLASSFLHWQSITIGNEGLTLAFVPDIQVLFRGLAVALILGFAAGLYPAWIATRQSIVTSLRDG